MKKLLFALICLLPVLTSQAGKITVDDDGPADFDNIPDAINSSTHGDTIVVKDGTYDKKISFNNLAITLTSEDPNDPNVVQATIITTNSGYSVRFDFGEGSDSVLTGFTITGQGIHCYGTSPTISKNIIRDCIRYGIHGEDDAAPVISDNTIVSNSWEGIYYCNGPITNNIISENRVGIAYCDGPVTNNIISNNSDDSYGRGGALSFCKGRISGNLIAYNYAVYKGGACYECPGDIINNIIIGNRSFIAGGALCNCHGRVMNNIISGNRANNGGGLFSCSKVYNNTIVGNLASETGGGLSQCPGFISNNIIAFNKADSVGGINGDCISTYNAFWSNEGGNFGGTATAGTGDIITNPLFASDGYWDDNETPDESDDFWVDGDYHVKSEAGRWDPNSQIWVNDEVTSPCVDAGDPNSDWTAELWPHGKHINIGEYGGTAQASASLSDVGNVADLNPDINDANDWIDYSDMAIFVNKWLYNEVLLAEDLDRDGMVDFTDFAILVNNWQPQPMPPQPPTPNPMTWATEPHATSTTTIEMTATTANSTDDSGIEYYFECSTPGGHDSGWQDEQDYTDSGLTPNTEYSYKVKARNKTNIIETVYSDPSSATTLPDDTTPPSPDPATWETEPYVYLATSIRMVATTATDDSGVEYQFKCTSNAAYSSQWQDSSEYVTSPPKGAYYSFVVRIRDKSPNQNTTGDSAEVTVDFKPP
ncbi:MAG: NosD domain-containing protein, partial [Planctomycetota bacterium]